MKRTTLDKAGSAASTVEQQASEAFIQRFHGEWSAQDQTKLDERLASDCAYADAFHGIEKSWQAIGTHAESPELMKLRESAIAWIRRENANRWSTAPQSRRTMLAACVGILAAALALVLQLSPWGYRPNYYSTGIGQQTKMELPDSSQVELDAVTRLQVQFTDTARTIRLLEGQAQFSVARDPSRPFLVQAGERTIVAIGTVFTVEYIERKIHVATIAGKVAVLHAGDAAYAESKRPDGDSEVALEAGEEIHIAADGKIEFVENADLAAATAWREGNVIFRDEPLGDAVRRLNRYSHLQLQILNPALAMLRISGVFEKGDSAAFARSVQAYYPVVAAEGDGNAISLRLK